MSDLLSAIADRLALAVHYDAHPSCCVDRPGVTCSVFDNMRFHVDAAFADVELGRDDKLGKLASAVEERDQAVREKDGIATVLASLGTDRGLAMLVVLRGWPLPEERLALQRELDDARADRDAWLQSSNHNAEAAEDAERDRERLCDLLDYFADTNAHLRKRLRAAPQRFAAPSAPDTQPATGCRHCDADCCPREWRSALGVVAWWHWHDGAPARISKCCRLEPPSMPTAEPSA